MKVHLHNFSNIKSHKEVTKQRESMFFFAFLLDDDDGYGAGSVPKPDAQRPNNIRIRIRVCNTGRDLFYNIAGIILFLSRYSSMFSTIYTQKADDETNMLKVRNKNNKNNSQCVGR